jgi:hypothetical protein
MPSGERPHWTNVGEAPTCLRRAADRTKRESVARIRGGGWPASFNFKAVFGGTGRADV